MRRGRRLACALAIFVATVGGARAADLDVVRAAPMPDGVPCDGPVAQTFQSVWLGHFSGGYSHDLGPGAPIALDWRDEKLCFASLRLCRHYISEMRRDFHRPEGYFTCLPIR